MPWSSARLLLSSAVIALMSEGSDGAPLPCKKNKLCLTDFNNEKFHRLTLKCLNFTADLNKNGDVLGRDVFYDDGSRCITRRSEVLLQCTVKETDHNGLKKTLRFTYNCTPEFDTSTTPTLIPDGQTLTTLSTAPSPADSKKRHHWVIAAIVFLVLLLLVCWICPLAWLSDFPWTLTNRKPQTTINPGESEEAHPQLMHTGGL